MPTSLGIDWPRPLFEGGGECDEIRANPPALVPSIGIGQQAFNTLTQLKTFALACCFGPGFEPLDYLAGPLFLVGALNALYLSTEARLSILRTAPE